MKRFVWSETKKYFLKIKMFPEKKNSKKKMFLEKKILLKKIFLKNKNVSWKKNSEKNISWNENVSLKQKDHQNMIYILLLFCLSVIKHR